MNKAYKQPPLKARRQAGSSLALGACGRHKKPVTKIQSSHMRGTYVLLAHVPYDLVLSVGELGNRPFKAGYYSYVGSALGGLEARVGRHLRQEKLARWHIDYLLARARAVDVVVAESDERKECSVAGELAKNLSSIQGFGTSDCKCESHLFYSPDPHELLRRVLLGFKACGLKPKKGVTYG